jgi:hypothetical protein
MYGAGYRGQLLAGILLKQNAPINIKKLVVTNKEFMNNTLRMCNLNICTLDEINDPSENTVFFVGTVSKYIDEILNNLREHGFYNYIVITEELFKIIESSFAEQKYREEYGSFNKNKVRPKKDSDIDLKVYMVKSEYDKKLKVPNIDSLFIPIHAGADLAKDYIAKERDNIGKNISMKNINLNELTVLYWIWKNVQAEYVGLCHYRRIFNKQNIVSCLSECDIDVILGQPVVQLPDLRAHYERCHFPEDFQLMMNVLQQKHPDYYETANYYFNGNIFIPYNMLIAKSRVLSEYAEWLFPIIFEMEKQWKNKNDSYQNRALAFLGERLMGVYFLHHRKELNIKYENIEVLEVLE